MYLQQSIVSTQLTSIYLKLFQINFFQCYKLRAKYFTCQRSSIRFGKFSKTKFVVFSERKVFCKQLLININFPKKTTTKALIKV